MTDLQKTQHYTTEGEYILQGLKEYIMENYFLIEPFYGNGDLVKLFPNNKWEKFDIEEKEGCKIQDTLLNPPNYKDKWVITNPPFLAKNKAKDKTIFDLYKVDDLYKAFLVSIKEAEGGIIIIPTNFFTDERTEKIRKIFFDNFEVIKINFFTQPVFKSTTYTVCAFFFHKRKTINYKEKIKITIFPSKKESFIILNRDSGYRIGGDFLRKIENQKSIFERLTDKSYNGYLTNIKLIGLDTRAEPLHLEYNETPYIGKQTDRIYATMICQKELDIETQKFLIEKFNQIMSDFRAETNDLCLTNYRDFNRKRISFTFCYKLLSYIFENFSKL